MLQNFGRFLDVMVFAFLMMILGSWQLQHAYVIGSIIEGVIAVAALLFAVGLFLGASWSISGMVCTLAVAIFVYFIEMFLPSMHHSGFGFVVANIVKILIAALLLWYMNRQRVENRFAVK